MSNRGYYADPTAWEAIKRADRKVTHKSPLSTNSRGAPAHHSGVWVAPEAKLLDKRTTIIRPENRSIFTMLRRKLDEDLGSGTDL